MDGSASSPTRQSPWMPFESRRRARDEKREAVLRTAVALFLEQGYHGTTLNDVAERLNITKPALYNYFRGKDAILYECWAIGAERVDESIDQIAATGGTGLEKLRKLITGYAETMTTDYGKSLVRFDVRDLTEHNRKIVRLAKKKIDQAFRDYIGQGIRDGTIRPCDVKLSAFAERHRQDPAGGLGENRMVAPGRSSDHAELLRLGHRLRFGDVLRRPQEQYPAHHFGPSGRT